MTRRQRSVFFFISAAGLAAFVVWGFVLLPGFGHYRGPYGLIINAVAVNERHATDVVTAVNLDYRGVDTIGEEFILFTAAVAVALLLREERSERKTSVRDEDAPGLKVPITSDAVRATSLMLTGVLVVLGMYIVSHGHLTPGGGFQGGVILASALVMIYLAGEFRALRQTFPTQLLDPLEAIGAAGFVAVGFAGLIAGAAFLQNIWPLGSTGSLNSAGTMPVIYLSVGLEVGAAFVVIASEFLEQVLVVRGPQDEQPG